MSISVNFYQNLSDNRYMDKNIQLLQENVSCDIYEPCDRLNPQLIIDKDLIDLVTCNYCVIPEFGRKYFITDIVPQAGNLVTLNCHVDVLGTYSDEIKHCQLIAARSSNQPNYYLQDDMRIFNTYTYNQYIDIGQDIGAPSSLILITI